MDVQADLSLRWAHSHFVGFVVRRLNYTLTPFTSMQTELKGSFYRPKTSYSILTTKQLEISARSSSISYTSKGLLDMSRAFQAILEVIRESKGTPIFSAHVKVYV